MSVGIAISEPKYISELKRLWSGAWSYFSEQEIPGHITQSNVQGTRQVYTVKLGVAVYDPSGNRIDSVLCEPALGVRRGNYVLTRLTEPEDGKSILRGDIKKVLGSDADFRAAVRAFATEHAAWINITEAASPLAEPLKIAEECLQDARKRVANEKARVDQERESLSQRESRLKNDQLAFQQQQSRADLILAREAQLRKAESEFAECGGQAVAQLLKPFVTRNKAMPEVISPTLPVSKALEHFIRWTTTLGYACDDFTALQFLAAVCSAVRTGQFTILSGPTGTGKTSLVSIAAKIFDCGHGVVPVRPAWIDSTDLLGFFDVRNERFHPTPFMDCLVQAVELSLHDRLFFLVLDEMNLSRVENYAGDLLSQLEKARAGEGSLKLYSSDIFDLLQSKVGDLTESLKECSTSINEGLANRLILKQHLSRYPAEFEIPNNLCVLGTLNIDETTYMPSPKFLDRSFVIQKSPSTLDLVLASHSGADNVIPQTLSRTQLEELVCDGSDSHYKALASALLSNETALTELGIHLGFRFSEAAKAFCAVTSCWQDVSENDVIDALFLSKVLPKLTFHEDEKSPTGVLKRDVLEQWSVSESIRNFTRSKDAIQRILSFGGPVFRYLE